jgi:AcrR family transcriptional regulator
VHLLQLYCNDMTDPVKTQSSLRATHVAQTEQRLIAAAGRLFLANGYASTSLNAVAADAGVSPRTVYVRFGTKAALLKQVIEVAVVGDAETVALMDRPGTQPALHAPTLVERIDAWATVARQIMGRIGPLVTVATEAAATEPDIAELVAVWRDQSLSAERAFWTRAAADGLLDPAVDVHWATVTANALDTPETYIRLIAQHGWSLEQYQAWLAHSLLAIATGASLTP